MSVNHLIYWICSIVIVGSYTSTFVGQRATKQLNAEKLKAVTDISGISVKSVVQIGIPSIFGILLMSLLEMSLLERYGPYIFVFAISSIFLVVFLQRRKYLKELANLDLPPSFSRIEGIAWYIKTFTMLFVILILFLWKIGWI